MIIEKIAFDEKLNLFRIETEKESFLVNYSDYEKFNLHKDMEIDSELYIELKSIALKNKAYSDAINFLSYRMRTKKEMEDKLLKKFPQDICSSIVRRLTEEGLINDRNFAKVYIESKLHTSNWSLRKIKYQLHTMGIANKMADEIILELDSENLEYENAKKLIEKQIEKWESKYKDSYSLRNKIYSFLGTRGFSYDTISIIMEEFGNE